MMQEQRFKKHSRKRNYGNRKINKEHRARGRHAYRKRHAYSPQKAALEQQQLIEAGLHKQQRLETYTKRARTLTDEADIRALHQEVWRTRHELPEAVSMVPRIIKARREAGELPNPYVSH